MPARKQYKVMIAGLPHTVKLTEEEAARTKGAVLVTARRAAKAAATPQNKTATGDETGTVTADETVTPPAGGGAPEGVGKTPDGKPAKK